MRKKDKKTLALNATYAAPPDANADGGECGPAAAAASAAAKREFDVTYANSMATTQAVIRTEDSADTVTLPLSIVTFGVSNQSYLAFCESGLQKQRSVLVGNAGLPTFVHTWSHVPCLKCVQSLFIAHLDFANRRPKFVLHLESASSKMGPEADQSAVTADGSDGRGGALDRLFI